MIYKSDKLFNFDDAISQGGLNWIVSEGKVFDDRNNEIEGYKRIVRSDNGNTLAIHKNSYEVSQHLGNMREFDTMLGLNPEKYNSAGNFKGGRQVYIQSKMPDFNNEKEVFFSYTTSYDGSITDLWFTGCQFILCKNTFVLAIENAVNKWSVKHTKSAKEKIEEWKRVFSETLAYYNNFDLNMNYLKSKKMESKEIETFVSDLILPKGVTRWEDLESKFVKPEMEMVKISTRSKNQYDKVMELIETGEIDKQDNRNSAYGVLMGISNYTSNEMSSRGKDDEAREENRMYSVLMGSARELNQRAFDKLIRY